MEKRPSNLDRVEALMRDGRWRTRLQVEAAAELRCAPQTTTRTLRYLRDRGYELEKRADEEVDGLYWYRAVRRPSSEQGDLFAPPPRRSRATPPPTRAQRRELALAFRERRIVPPLERSAAVDALIDWLLDAYDD